MQTNTDVDRVDLALLIRFAALSCCVSWIGCGGGGGGSSSPPQSSQFAIVVDPALATNGTTDQGSLLIHGIILKVGPSPYPTALAAGVSNGSGSTSLDLAVDPQGNWFGDLPLAPGDNQIHLVLPGGEASDDLRFTYNPNYAFGGTLHVAPDVAYVGQSRDFTATIPLGSPSTDPNNVEFVRVDAGVETPVSLFSDDGNAANGDQTAGDGIFSTLFPMNETSAGEVSMRVRVHLLGGGDPARSEAVELLVAMPLDPAEMTQILDLQQQYGEQLDAALAAGNTSAVVDQIGLELSANPLVAEFGELNNGLGLWVIYTNGIWSMLFSAPPGTMGAGQSLSSISGRTNDDLRAIEHRDAGGSTSGSRLPAWLEPEQPPRIQPLNVGNTRALGLAPYNYQFGSYDAAPVIESYLELNGCFQVDRVHDTSAGGGSIEDFKILHRYGVVVISTHGGIIAGEEVLGTNAPVNLKGCLTCFDDLRKHRLAIGWVDGVRTFAITPSFIDFYSSNFPQSLVYVSACDSASNLTMAQIFQRKGAAAYLGYSNEVSTSFTFHEGTNFFCDLVQSGATVSTSFVPGHSDHPNPNVPPGFFLFPSGGDASLGVGCTNAPPQAGFSASPLSGEAPLTVHFTDQSTGAISSRTWSFGDGSTSSETNPSHSYVTAGTFTVSLTVRCAADSDTETRPGLVHVTPPPDPCNSGVHLTVTPLQGGTLLRIEWCTGNDVLQQGAHFWTLQAESGDFCGWSDLFFAQDEPTFSDVVGNGLGSNYCLRVVVTADEPSGGDCITGIIASDRDGPGCQ